MYKLIRIVYFVFNLKFIRDHFLKRIYKNKLLILKDVDPPTQKLF